MPAPLRLRLDGDALFANWRTMARLSGAAACGAAVKADAFGLGARDVVARLAAAGCRDFFVATWDEAAALGDLPEGACLSVLHGVRAEDMAAAHASAARPVLNTPAQVARWRETGRACDVMIDTGINRLGLSVDDVTSGMLDGLVIETLMSHLACAGDDNAMNERQRRALAEIGDTTNARRVSLANSAGIALGPEYNFDLTRPGLALYGGILRPELENAIGRVAYPEVQVLQRRRIDTGDSVGYDATWTAARATDVAILNIGYFRGFSGKGSCGGGRFPVLGRVSMDLLAIDVTGGDVGEGDWVDVDYDLRDSARVSGTSQYELLTGLGQRFERQWI